MTTEMEKKSNKEVIVRYHAIIWQCAVCGKFKSMVDEAPIAVARVKGFREHNNQLFGANLYGEVICNDDFIKLGLPEKVEDIKVEKTVGRIIRPI